MTNLTFSLVAADGATGSISATLPPINAPATTESFFASPTPSVPYVVDSPSTPATLGVQFAVTVAGAISAIRYYQGAQTAVFPIEVGLYAPFVGGAGGYLIGSGTFAGQTAAGWVTVPLATPISVVPGTTYTAAYAFPAGYGYPADDTGGAGAANAFAAPPYPKTNNQITVGSSAGVYNYAPSIVYPTSVWQNSNYYVDVVFEPGVAGQQPPPPPKPGPLHFGMFGQSTASDYAATEQQFGMTAGSMWLSGPGIAFDSWSNYDGSAFAAAQLAMQQGRTKIFINVPPIVNGETLTNAATGAFNAHYNTVAGQFNNLAFDTVVFRCIWEFQGNWYPWGWGGGQNQATYVTDFIGAFRQMVTTIRANMGNVKNVQFCFSGAQGDQVQMPNWQACYPGDAYVDWIGVDWYDGNPGDNTGTDLASEKARWAQDNAPGAAACLQLCIAHQKGFAIPEWSVGKCGDDPYFVDQVRATLQAVQNNGLPVFSGYWRGPYGGVNGDYNLYPNTLARMLADFPGSQTS